MKIRTRLTLQFILICAGIFTFALLFIFQQFRKYVENESFRHLESKGRMTAAMVLAHEEDLKVLDLPGQSDNAKLPSLVNVFIFNERLQCVFALNPAADGPLASMLESISLKGKERFYLGGYRAIGVVMYSKTGNKYIVFSEDKPDFSILITLRNILLVSFLLVIAAVAAGGWFYAGQALMPVSYIVNEVDGILPADLSRRLKKNNNNDELSHLVTTFNHLLDRIEHAFQMQRGFISNVSHELKNPIAVIDAQLQLARNKTRSVEEYGRVLESVHEDIKEIAETIDKLLELARIYSSDNSIELFETRLDELVYQSRNSLLKAHPDYVINIEIKKLPENEKELCIRGNEVLLRSALTNLMDNCCKFSNDHKAHLIIDYNSASQLLIQDNGPGIPESDLPYIFEPFFRGVQTSRKKGSGIGLSLVQSIFKFHHISMKVQSSPEKGTTFMICFPGEKSTDDTALNQNPQEADTSTNSDNQHLKPTKKVLRFFLLFSLAISVFNCSNSDKPYTSQNEQNLQLIQDWNLMLLDLVKHSSGYRPPVSARMFGYVGLAAWESGRPTIQNGQSLASLFPDLDLPIWPKEEPFIAPAALNQAYSTLARNFFPHASVEMEQKRRKLAARWEQIIKVNYPEEVIRASGDYGTSVANVIFHWSTTDSIGHQAFLYNYHPNYRPPVGEGLWKTNPLNGMPALLPFWGNARTFITDVQDIAVKAPASFSVSANSSFFAQALEVYSLSKPPSDEKTWIATFWSNDHPETSFCAASRWISIAHQVINTEKPDFTKSLEAYLRLGLALNDAAVKVWHEKYAFNLERPDTYIQRNIDPGWQPLDSTPPFPSYPSGHATFGAAAAAVLSNMFGDNFAMTDYSNSHDKTYTRKARSFHSFQEMAEENALSRLYMGVHYRMDCEEGLRIGKIIGKRIAGMELRNASRLATR